MIVVDDHDDYLLPPTSPVRVCEGFVYAGFKTKTVQYVVQLHTLGFLPFVVTTLTTTVCLVSKRIPSRSMAILEWNSIPAPSFAWPGTAALRTSHARAHESSCRF